MSTFDYYIDEFLFSFQSNYMKGIRIKITSDKKDFGFKAAKPYVRVFDEAGHAVESFRVEISGDQKELNALFTTNAFGAFTNPNHISFGYEGEKQMHLFENVDITNNISALIPPLDGLVVPEADNTWLASL